MTRFSAFLIFFLTIGAVPSFAQFQNQLDANPTLFAMMVAINAAGFDVDVDSPSNSHLRKEVRAALAGHHNESMEEMKRFFAAHRQKTPEAELTQYVSFALSIKGPPSFEFRVPDNEIPPDVSEMRGLELILPKFWEENGLADIWKRIEPEYEKTIAAYHAPVSRAVLESNAYLRNPTSGYSGRRFQVFVDLLGPPNQIQTRSYKDDYYVIVTPSPELPVDQIQYAYLHYLLDPLALRYSEQLSKKHGLEDFAEGAPALEDSYKHDYLLLTTSCLVKAIQSRLVHGEAARREMVEQDVREGFVYTAAFADGLPLYEKQSEAMRIYLPALITGIDLTREEQRLQKVEFAKHRKARTFKTEALPEPGLTGAAKTLDTAEDLYRGRSLDQAKETYLQVLQQTSQQPLHARAYYGLARIAALQKDPELAEKLFQKALELSPDPETKSWVYVYLGRLAMAAGEPGEAAKNYRAALAVEGASQAARSNAEKELEKTSVNK